MHGYGSFTLSESERESEFFSSLLPLNMNKPINFPEEPTGKGCHFRFCSMQINPKMLGVHSLIQCNMRYT